MPKEVIEKATEVVRAEEHRILDDLYISTLVAQAMGYEAENNGDETGEAFWDISFQEHLNQYRAEEERQGGKRNC